MARGDVAAADAGSIIGFVVDVLLGVNGERAGVVGLDLEPVVAGGADVEVGGEAGAQRLGGEFEMVALCFGAVDRRPGPSVVEWAG